MSVELKIKSKHLALEAKVIRFEEAKLKKQIKWLYKNKPSGNEIHYALLKFCSLSDHRKNIVGAENRATFLARAFIAGMPYKKVEVSRKQEKEAFFVITVIPRVYDMVKKYAPYSMHKDLSLDAIKDWCFS